MKSTVKCALATLMLLAAAGCNSGGADNRAACEGYVNQINSLECFGGAAQLNPETTCSGYDDTTCDISDYFDCLTANTQCTTIAGMSVPDTSGTVSCADLARCD